MAFKEHENNTYTKEEEDRVRSYLRRIIQRYFEIENNVSQETKEAIIIQAFTRLKEYFNAYMKDFVICINEKSGAIDLSIKDLNGEKAFKKNTAFNKNFCEDGIIIPDTIVSGNDKRLSDPREPLYHIHSISDIDGLQERLDRIQYLGKQFHNHSNKDKVLDLIIYSGSLIEIDLILLESLEEYVEKSYKMFQEMDASFINEAKKFLNTLNQPCKFAYEKLKDIRINKIDSSIVWLQDAELYTDWEILRLIKEFKQYLDNFISKQDFKLLKEISSKSVKLIDSGTVDFGNDWFYFGDCETTVIKNQKEEYHNIPFYKRTGYSKVLLQTEDCTVIPTLENGNNVKDYMVKLYIEYDIEGEHHKDQLPHLYQVNNSLHDSILIYGEYYDEIISVRAKRISYIPALVENTMCFGYLYNDWVRAPATIIMDEHDDDFTNAKKDINKTPLNITEVLNIEDEYTIPGKTYTKNAGDITILNSDYAPKKDICTFIYYGEEDFNDYFTIHLKTGHFYLIQINEVDEDGNIIRLVGETNGGDHEVHDFTARTKNKVLLEKDHRYTVTTMECAAGGIDASMFVYTFDASLNFLVKVIENPEKYNITFKCTKDTDNNQYEISWNIQSDFDTSNFICKVLKRKYEDGKFSSWETLYVDNQDDPSSYVTSIIEKQLKGNVELHGKYLKDESTIFKPVYEITATNLAEYSYTEYKLNIYNKDNLITPIKEVGELVIKPDDSDIEFTDKNCTTIFDIGTLYQEDNENVEYFNPYYNLEFNGNKVKITADKTAMIDVNRRRIIFTDNITPNMLEDFLENIKEYNCSQYLSYDSYHDCLTLLKPIPSDDLDKINEKNMQKLYERYPEMGSQTVAPWMHLSNMYYYNEDNIVTQESGMTVETLDGECYHMGAYNFNGLCDYFTNPQITYQVFRVSNEDGDDT